MWKHFSCCSLRFRLFESCICQKFFCVQLHHSNLWQCVGRASLRSWFTPDRLWRLWHHEALTLTKIHLLCSTRRSTLPVSVVVAADVKSLPRVLETVVSRLLLSDVTGSNRIGLALRTAPSSLGARANNSSEATLTCVRGWKDQQPLTNAGIN